MSYPGLEDAFLRYIQATPEAQRRIQSFYLPFFQGCPGPVVDLACGHGDFVHLLTEHGVKAVGVDSDPACCAEVQERGIPVTCSDVFDYLRQVEPDNLGGIFSAHLVEHLPYERVMDLIRLSFDALQPGGLILLTTPNVRGLYPHLESFYMHFGHVTFYHPRLLGFFMEYFGFSAPHAGENPRMAKPLWRDVAWSDPGPPPLQALGYDPRLPSRLPGLAGRLVSAAKTSLARFLVQPLLDRLAGEVDRQLEELRRYVGQINANANAIHRQLAELDRPVECYVYATKGEATLGLPPEIVGERL
jgi:SAM-dependent methyltransferase